MTSPIHNSQSHEEPYPLQDSLYSISYLYWPLIAHLFTILVALVVGMIISATKRKREAKTLNKSAKDRTQSKAEIVGDVDDNVEEEGDRACDKCLGNKEREDNAIDIKLLSPLVRWMHQPTTKSVDVELQQSQSAASVYPQL